MPQLNHPEDKSFPRYLTPEEISDPKLVLVELFSYAHLSDLREELWNFLKNSVTGSLYKDASGREKGDMLHFYEHLVRLVEASHILYEQYKNTEPGKIA